MGSMIHEINDILKTSQHIIMVVEDKSKDEVNPLLIRIQYVIKELQTHLTALASSENDTHQQKYHWSVLFRVGDSLDEMASLIKNTTPVFIQTDVDYIKQRLVLFTPHVVQTFGKRQSLYIITPKYQELAGLW